MAKRGNGPYRQSNEMHEHNLRMHQLGFMLQQNGFESQPTDKGLLVEYYEYFRLNVTIIKTFKEAEQFLRARGFA